VLVARSVCTQGRDLKLMKAGCDRTVSRENAEETSTRCHEMTALIRFRLQDLCEVVERYFSQ
jgi:2-oxo-4-hydroxy-4-carboxy--5-ureidoimidazoline (OHCU) decarboxylase